MVRSAIDRATDSLFLIPATIIAILGVASQITLALDGQGSSGPVVLPTTLESARSILSTVATATVTVAAIVFSMTAVVVQLATSQFSPRVTQGFLRDRYQQATIGITIGTFVYALLVLAAVRGNGADTSHDLSVTVAVVLAVVSMMAIVSFIDRIMRSMRIDTIIRDLADQTQASIGSLPPREPLEEEIEPPDDTDSVTLVVASHSGWIRSIDIGAMFAALPGETAVRLEVRSGDYVARDEPVATAWPAIEDDAASGVADALEVGRSRTIDSDPAYGMRQMVDIALRALSPALNDPTTAADVVHHLTGPLRQVLTRELPGRVHSDDRRNRLYAPRTLTHSDYVHGALREIRINAIGQPHVLRALLESISSLVELLENEGLAARCVALRQEAEATMTVVEASGMPDRDKEYLRTFARSVGFSPSTDPEPASE